MDSVYKYVGLAAAIRDETQWKDALDINTYLIGGRGNLGRHS